jgi:hypothetical protein
MYKIIHIFLLIAIAFTANSQLYTWKAKILDANNNKPIESVAIYIDKTSIATFSDENGLFELKIPYSYFESTNMLSIRMYGYEEMKMNIDSNQLKTINRIGLKSKEIIICTIPIVEYKALTIVQKAVKALDTLYLNENKKQHFYYIQTHKENGKYVRMIESFLDFYPKKYTVNTNKIQQDQYTITSLARSNSFEQNEYQHGEHINDLLLENYFVYSLGSPLFLKNSQYYTYKFADTCDKINYYIYFDTKASSNVVKTRGVITIDRNNFAIKSIEVEKYKNAKSENESWKLRNATLKISTIEVNGKIFMDNMILNYSHDVQHQRTHNYMWVVEELFELHYLESTEYDNNQEINAINIEIENVHFNNNNIVINDVKKGEIEIAPNPVKDNFDLMFNAVNNGTSNIVIYSLNGEMVYNSTINYEIGYNKINVNDINSFSIGEYIIEFSSNDFRASKKICIIK